MAWHILEHLFQLASVKTAIAVRGMPLVLSRLTLAAALRVCLADCQAAGGASPVGAAGEGQVQPQ